MSQLAEQLRQARENLGISLAQAAAETHILQQWLIALEEGAFDRLPNTVVARGFVRNYALYLGLPADECIELYRQERGVSDSIRVVPTTRPPRSRSYVLPGFFGVFFVTVALIGLTYVALSAIGRIGDGGQLAGIDAIQTPTVATPTSLARPTDLSEAVGLNQPTPPPQAIASPTAVRPSSLRTATPRPSPTQEAPIVVEVSIPPDAGISWLRVQTDGTIVYEQTMRGGEQEIFLANRQVFIRAGNPTVVQVNVNGQQRGPLGQIPGQPVDWYWPPQSQ